MDLATCQRFLDGMATGIQDNLIKAGPGARNPDIEREMRERLRATLPFQHVPGIKIPSPIKICLPLLASDGGLDILEGMQQELHKMGEILADGREAVSVSLRGRSGVGNTGSSNKRSRDSSSTEGDSGGEQEERVRHTKKNRQLPGTRKVVHDPACDRCAKRNVIVCQGFDGGRCDSCKSLKQGCSYTGIFAGGEDTISTNSSKGQKTSASTRTVPDRTQGRQNRSTTVQDSQTSSTNAAQQEAKKEHDRCLAAYTKALDERLTLKNQLDTVDKKIGQLVEKMAKSREKMNA